MKAEILKKLHLLETRLRKLQREVINNETGRIGKVSIRNEASAIADQWVEEVRSPLEHRFHLPKETIEEYAAGFKRLYILSRPNNHKSSYLETIDALLRKFKDRLILPVQQYSLRLDQVIDLTTLINGLPDPAESEYLKEAVECALHGYTRAAIVLGWCAAMDRIQRKIEHIGFDKFNQASHSMAAQTAGRFRRLIRSSM